MKQPFDNTTSCFPQSDVLKSVYGPQAIEEWRTAAVPAVYSVVQHGGEGHAVP